MRRGPASPSAWPARQWPCYFFASDTTGEKDFEEFYTDRETLDMARFESIGVIKNEPVFEPAKLELFTGTHRRPEGRPGSGSAMTWWSCSTP